MCNYPHYTLNTCSNCEHLYNSEYIDKCKFNNQIKNEIYYYAREKCKHFKEL